MLRSVFELFRSSRFIFVLVCLGNLSTKMCEDYRSNKSLGDLKKKGHFGLGLLLLLLIDLLHINHEINGAQPKCPKEIQGKSSYIDILERNIEK